MYSCRFLQFSIQFNSIVLGRSNFTYFYLPFLVWLTIFHFLYCRKTFFCNLPTCRRLTNWPKTSPRAKRNVNDIVHYLGHKERKQNFFKTVVRVTCTCQIKCTSQSELVLFVLLFWLSYYGRAARWQLNKSGQLSNYVCM